MKLVTKAALAAVLASAWPASGMCAAAAGAPALRGDASPAPPAEAEQTAETTDNTAGAAQTPAPADAPDAAAAAAAARELLVAEARTAAMSAAPAAGAPQDPMVEMAATYALYQRDLAAIRDRELAEPVDLDTVMDTLASYDSGALSASVMAYAAFVAAQQPAFVDKVREVADYYGQAQLLQGMINDPRYALTFPGAEEAAGVVLDVLEQDVETLHATASRFKQESYDLQNRGWRNLIARDRDERLSQIRNAPRLSQPSAEMLASVAYGAPIASSEPADVTQLRRTAFWEAVDYRTEPPRAGPGDAMASNEGGEVMGVVMTLAALRTLGQSSQRPDLVTRLIGAPRARACLDFSLLHMEQCVAAAHFKYEDAFCIAEHQLEDTAECLSDSLDIQAAEPAPAPETVPPTQSANAEPAAPAGE